MLKKGNLLTPKHAKPKRTILGLDPGSLRFGVALIEENPGNLLCLRSCHTIVLEKQGLLPRRLNHLYNELNKVFRKYSPDLVAIEEVFYHKNVKSAVTLAHARSIGLLLSATYDAPLLEFSPRKIKLAVTGKGSATKQEVRHMLAHYVKEPTQNLDLDSSDAAAVALCACFDRGGTTSQARKKKKSSAHWTLEDLKATGLKIKEG